jgi:hypothetical protein
MLRTFIITGKGHASTISTCQSGFKNRDRSNLTAFKDRYNDPRKAMKIAINMKFSLIAIGTLGCVMQYSAKVHHDG